MINRYVTRWLVWLARGTALCCDVTAERRDNKRRRVAEERLEEDKEERKNEERRRGGRDENEEVDFKRRTLQEVSVLLYTSFHLPSFLLSLPCFILLRKRRVC